MPPSVESRTEHGLPAPRRMQAMIEAGVAGGEARGATVLDGLTGDREIMAEVERLLSGRTRDIRLKGRLAEGYRQRSWRQTANVIRAWMIWVVVVYLFMFGLNLYLLAPERAVAMLFPGALIVPAALIVAFVWRKPRPPLPQGAALVTGMLVIFLSVCWMGLADGSVLFDRYLHIMLFVAISGVIIFSIPLAQTTIIALSAIAFYLVFQLGNQGADVWESLSGFFFFATGMAATVMARRTMNIIAHKSFLLELRDRQLLAELSRTNRRLERLSRTDGLTGAANRHFLRERLDELSRRGSSVAVLMCDIDHFKALNDHLGHMEGDRCLVEVARLIMKCTRSEADCVARYGGEEFLVVLPDASEAEAVSTAERIRASVAAAGLPNPGSGVKPTVTLSIGLAVGDLRQGQHSSEKIQRRADTALYFAKRAGRDRVQHWHRDIEGNRRAGSAA